MKINLGFNGLCKAHVKEEMEQRKKLMWHQSNSRLNSIQPSALNFECFLCVLSIESIYESKVNCNCMHVLMSQSLFYAI